MFILILVVFSSKIIVVNAQLYGEDNDGLGQFVDDYENMDYIGSYDDVNRSVTGEYIELNQTIYPSYNLSVFTEVDAGNYIEYNDTTCEWVQEIRNTDARLHNDFGAGYFDDFTILFDIEYTDVEAGDATNNDFHYPIWLCDVVGNFATMWGGSGVLVGAQQDAGVDDRYRLSIRMRSAGVTVSDSTRFYGVGAKFYCIFNRTGTTADLYLYNNSDFTVLEDKLSVTRHGINLRYMSLSVSRNSAVDPNDYSSGYIENIRLGMDSYVSFGYYITTDYLLEDGVDGVSLVGMYNTSIPLNGAVTLQFSNNGVDWYDNDNVTGSVSLDSGYYSIDLRDLFYDSSIFMMVNLTIGSDGTSPMVYQVRLVSAGGVTSDAGLFFPVGIALGLCIPLGLVYVRRRKR